jgi:pyruvate kinase
VLDGTDCVMLSGETANGAFPVIAVETMAKICSEAELCYNNEATFWSRIKSRGRLTEAEALATSAVQLSFEIGASVIVCFTLTGEIARLISKYRPRVPIVAIRYSIPLNDQHGRQNHKIVIDQCRSHMP